VIAHFIKEWPKMKMEHAYFNFALDPKINSGTAKGAMPKADDKMLKDITKSFKQLSRDIKGAMADGNGHPLADSTPQSMTKEATRNSASNLPSEDATVHLAATATSVTLPK
jgi:hypothetical protein